MSRYYASIQGGKGEVTRQGHNAITGHVRGWKVGVQVDGFTGPDGGDAFEVWTTGGSSKHCGRVLLGVVSLSAEGVPMFTPAVQAAAKQA